MDMLKPRFSAETFTTARVLFHPGIKKRVTINNNKVIEAYQKVLKVSIPGAMECWSKEKEGIKLSAITPRLQHSNTPKLIEIKI
jgi:hypothetical protein